MKDVDCQPLSDGGRYARDDNVMRNPYESLKNGGVDPGRGNYNGFLIDRSEPGRRVAPYLAERRRASGDGIDPLLSIYLFGVRLSRSIMSFYWPR